MPEKTGAYCHRVNLTGGDAEIDHGEGDVGQLSEQMAAEQFQRRSPVGVIRELQRDLRADKE